MHNLNDQFINKRTVRFHDVICQAIDIVTVVVMNAQRGN